MLENYLSASQLADKLGITRQGVHKMIKEGKVRYERIGKQYFIPKEELSKLSARALPRKD